MHRTLACMALAAGLLGFVGGSSAGVIPTLIGSPTNLGNGEFQFDYQVVLQNNEAIQANDFLTIYDVQGLVAGSGAFAASAGISGGLFSVTSALNGPTPPGLDPNVIPPFTGDFAESNLTLRYDGPLLTAPPNSTGTNELTLGILSYRSIYGGIGLGTYSSTSERSVGPLAGQPENKLGLVSTPTPGFVPAAVPEPSTIVLSLVGGVAFLGLGLRRRPVRA